MRQRLKNYLMNAYCDGWMPAWVVAAAFSVFKLKAL